MTDKYNFDGTIFAPSEIGFCRQYAAPSDIKLILQNAVCECDFKSNAKGVKLCNLPFSFDIETTSFERENNGKTEKLATMYVWQFGVNGYIIIGRYWFEFVEMIKTISKVLQLNENKRIIVYIHNLSFEFQFIRKMFDWVNVFSIEERRPLYALSVDGIEFRCSYLLSGYSLATVAKNLVKYKIKKLVGDLDYSLKRHSETPLNDNEIAYCVNDVKIVMLYIKEYLENVRNIHSIPLTKTGGVRKFCRKECFTIITDSGKKANNYDYKHLISGLKIKDLSEFNAMQRAFCGGFTHANANYVNKVINNVASYDFTSSYPAVMVAEKYPMTYGVKMQFKSNATFENLIRQNKYCVIFDIEFNDICANDIYENYISVSKCIDKEKHVENNGRLVCAKRITLTITEIDFMIIRKNYNFSSYRIGTAYVYGKQYLPTEFVKAILQLYKKKTELKGVDGMENEYLNSKEMLNSCYGMCVTSPLRNTITYKNDLWDTDILSENEKREMLLKYNLSENRFLFYLWGVYVTAYARRNLWSGILNIKNDYIYSDTDSIKFINAERHKEYFAAYNAAIENKLKTACNYHNLDYALCAPQTIKGKTKVLGVWDFEGVYNKFKTLGAKRYLVNEKDALTVDGKKYDFSLTVSGINKKKAIPYLLEKYGENGIFEAFDNYLYLPPNYSGKNILTYIDYETDGLLTDYLGNTKEFHELSSVNLSPSEYTLNLSVLFLQYLGGLKEFKK